MLTDTDTKVIGIDGCRAGWCLIGYLEENYFFELHHSLSEVFKTHPDTDICLIDIPLGLPERNQIRDLEIMARKELSPGFTSSIFTPPCYEAMFAIDYAEARQINRQITGKSLSVQSWNLVPKMREANEFLIGHPDWQNKVIESHPEINFKKLNNGQLLKFRKAEKNGTGIRERLAIMERHDKNIPSLFNKFKEVHPKKLAKNDDLTDAFCLCLTARIGVINGFQLIQGKTLKNTQGIENRLATIRSC